MQDENAKSAAALGTVRNVKTHVDGNLSSLVPPRKVRRAAYWALPRSQRPIWAHVSLGRATHRLEPAAAKPYVPKVPTHVGDFSNLALADLRRSIKNRRWLYYVNFSR